MRPIRSLALVALALLSACAVPEARLRAGLVNAGLSHPMAACMAERMVHRLSLMQLRRIGDLPYARNERSVTGFLRRVRALRDPQIVTASASAATICLAQRLANLRRGREGLPK